MKRLLCLMLLIVAVGGFSLMASKVTFTEFSNIEDELLKLSNKKIKVGVIAEEDSLLIKYAAANEFGATITPKKGKYLAIPLQPEFKDKSPRDFPPNFFKLVPNDPNKPFKSAKLMAGNVEAFLLVKKVVIPERAFMRTALDNKKNIDKAINLARPALERLLMGSGIAEDVCVAIGESIASSIKANISSNIGPPNSGLTKRLKGSSKTLIDSGDLLKHIGYEIEG